MNETYLFVIIVLVVLGTFAILVMAIRSRAGASAKFSVGELFSLDLSVSPEQKASAADAVGEAAKLRQQPGPVAVQQLNDEIATLQEVRLTRLLWVDDHPDNNVFESLALMQLGVFVTSATSNSAAHQYLAKGGFDVVITDLGRGRDSDDGNVLVAELHKKYPQLPVIVYTSDAQAHRDGLRRAGAYAVEDQPAPLVNVVLEARSGTNGDAATTA